MFFDTAEGAAAAAGVPSSAESHALLVQRFKFLNLVQQVAKADLEQCVSAVGIEALTATGGKLSRETVMNDFQRFGASGRGAPHERLYEERRAVRSSSSINRRRNQQQTDETQERREGAQPSRRKRSPLQRTSRRQQPAAPRYEERDDDEERQQQHDSSHRQEQQRVETADTHRDRTVDAQKRKDHKSSPPPQQKGGDSSQQLNLSADQLDVVAQLLRIRPSTAPAALDPRAVQEVHDATTSTKASPVPRPESGAPLTQHGTQTSHPSSPMMRNAHEPPKATGPQPQGKTASTKEKGVHFEADDSADEAPPKPIQSRTPQSQNHSCHRKTRGEARREETATSESENEETNDEEDAMDDNDFLRRASKMLDNMLNDFDDVAQKRVTRHFESNYDRELAELEDEKQANLNEEERRQFFERKEADREEEMNASRLAAKKRYFKERFNSSSKSRRLALRNELPLPMVKSVLDFQRENREAIRYNERQWNTSNTSQQVFADRLTDSLIFDLIGDICDELGGMCESYVDGLAAHELQIEEDDERADDREEDEEQAREDLPEEPL